ncbi:MAG: hypothetical protein WAL41_10785, partial [Mycobacterium sp.]
MTVAYDSKVGPVQDYNLSSISYNHTTVATDTRIYIFISTITTSATTLSATVDGNTATAVGPAITLTSFDVFQIFYYDVTSSGSHAIVVSSSKSASYFDAGSVAYTGVTTNASQTTNTGSGNPATLSVPSTSSSNLVISACTTTSDFSAEQTTIRLAALGESFDITSSDQPGTGSNVSSSWNPGVAGSWAAIGFEASGSTPITVDLLAAHVTFGAYPFPLIFPSLHAYILWKAYPVTPIVSTGVTVDLNEA